MQTVPGGLKAAITVEVRRRGDSGFDLIYCKFYWHEAVGKDRI